MSNRRKKIWKRNERGKCKVSNKVMFTEREARRVVTNSIKSNIPKRKECRYYFCNDCDSWHTTSLDKEKFIEVNKLDESDKGYILYHTDKWCELIKKQEMQFNYNNVIGFQFDTNQLKSTPTNLNEAKDTIDKIISIYGIKSLYNIKLIGNRFTSYTYHYTDNLKDNESLYQYLNK